MEKKIILITLMIFSMAFLAWGQKEEKIVSVIDKMCIVQPTISPGYMLSYRSLWNSYFHATLEWCFDNRVSIRADGSYFFDTQGDVEPLRMNHSLLLGAFYHWPVKKVDFYIGLQPGASMVQQDSYSYSDSTIMDPVIKVAPVITSAAGFSYFFWKYMHIFLSVKYIHGNHVAQYGPAIPLDELRISAGLGLQIPFGNNKKKENK